MATVIFVHGISIRFKDYKVYMSRIEGALGSKLPKVKVTGCLWGDDLGAKLLADGASIPRYSQTKAMEQAAATIEESQRWDLLAEDPLIEFSLLALRPSTQSDFDPRGTKSEKEILDERLRKGNLSPVLISEFEARGITSQLLEDSRRQICENNLYSVALKSASDDLGEFQEAWSRAVVALVMAKTEGMVISPNLASSLAAQLSRELGNQQKGLISDWLSQAMATVATRALMNRRGRISDAIVPFVGDVLVYQGNGQRIRDRIAKQIGEVEDSSIVLLGHSLGGIACVDLLAENALPSVKLLITAGSQSPLLYEMDALQRIRFGQQLPAHFPAWLNIYDMRDFLSYVAEPVFKDPRVQDKLVDNRQQFPQSHGAYWSNPSVWDLIVSRLTEVVS